MDFVSRLCDVELGARVLLTLLPMIVATPHRWQWLSLLKTTTSSDTY